MSAETIRVDNLLTEIKYAFHAEDFARAELLASELHTVTRTARKVSELVIVVPTPNKEAVTRMTA